jgi:hypothetical protein
MSDSVQFDQGALQAAVGEMAAAYSSLSTKFDEVVTKAQDISPSWKTPEGVSFYEKFENIKTGIANFKASYATFESFLSGSVAVDYSKIEADIAAALAGGGN